MTKNWTRRDFLQSAAISAAGLGLLNGCQAAGQKTAAQKRPNLLFVFSDQQSRDAVGCYGNEQIITPNLDKMAQEGIQFEHCVSISPVCTPFRSMLMSGQHPLYNGAFCNDRPMLAHNGKTFGECLRDAGYKTGYIGKWHLYGGDRNRPVPAGPMRYGFDGTFLTNNCHVDFRPGKCYYWNDQGEKVFFDEWEVYGQTRQALEFLDQCKEDEPFALFVSWHPPHDWGQQENSTVYRYDSMPELMAMYDPDKLQLRPSVKDSPEVRRAYHGYYAMCSGVDKAFGWLMDKLRQKGVEDNTLVVFTSDHGDNLSSYDYAIAKDHPEDTASRIPFLLRWPEKLKTHRKSDLLIGPMDMMPTVLGLLDMDIPKEVQGKDLSQAIQQGDDDAVDSLPMFFYQPHWAGVRTRDFTYGRGHISHHRISPDGSRGMVKVPLAALYDRRSDPLQVNNLFGKPEAADLQKKMEALTQQWQRHFGDPGLSFEEIEKYYRYPDKRSPQDTREKGYQGRPIDVLRKAGLA